MDTPKAFEFPFKAYDIQDNFMKVLFSVIENEQFGIFESPTGTGKSLSIICGAIRWLKDHQTFVTSQYQKDISILEAEKLSASSEGNDWISAQSKEIEITHKVNKLRLEYNSIEEYFKKFDDLKEKKKGFTKEKRQNLKLKPTKGNEELLSEDKNPTDEDLLIEEGDNNGDQLSDEEREVTAYRPTKIFICSRTHSQLSQFIGEIIKSPFGENVRVVSLASRQNYCINPNVSKLKHNSLINERCLDMQKKSTKASKVDDDGKVTKRKNVSVGRCPYYRQQAIDDLRDWALLEVHDVEDMLNSGKELSACPYYASRKAAEDAEVVLIPYNTLLHKATREANGISLKGNVVIIDEAHNLLEALAQMHGCELLYNHIFYSLQQIKCYKKRFHTQFSAKNLLYINQLIFVIEKLFNVLECVSSEDETNIFKLESFVLTAGIDNFNMFKIIKFCKESRIAQKIRSFALRYPNQECISQPVVKKGIRDFLGSIQNSKHGKLIEEKKINEPRDSVPVPSNPLLSVISFLESLTYSYEDGRILLSKHKDRLQNKLQFLLLNPSSQFSDIVKQARSVIVAGGTMKPMSEFKERLFVSAGADLSRIVEFSCDHIVPPENILPIILTKGPSGGPLLFNYESRMTMGNTLKQVLVKVCETVKGGVVVFFPSYKYETWFWQQVKDIQFGRPVFREPQQSGSVDIVLEKYADAIKKSACRSALMFSVVGGKLSEGLNFSDDLGRCVIVVGLPYANIMAADLKEKMSYLDKTEGYGSGKKFYENLCMKSVNQCIGRAVRHQNDFATVLLLDERFSRVNTKNSLPNWIKRSLKVCSYNEAFDLINKFFKDK